MCKLFIFVFLVPIFPLHGQNLNEATKNNSRISFTIFSCRIDSMILDSDTLFLEIDTTHQFSSSPSISFFKVPDLFHPTENFNAFELYYKTEETPWEKTFFDTLTNDSGWTKAILNFGFSGYWWTINDSILVLEPWDWKRVFVFQLSTEGDKKYLVSIPQP